MTDADFARTLAAAEAAFQGRDWVTAYDRYLELFDGSVCERVTAGEDLRAEDFLVLDRLATLALYTRRPRGTTELLRVIEDLQLAADRPFAVQFAAVRRAAVHVCAGELTEAEKVFDTRLRERFGPLAELPDTPSGFTRWEQSIPWPDADVPTRAVLMVGYLYAAGVYLACSGQYRRAAAALDRGVGWANPESAALAFRARPLLQLALAAVRLEQGEFDRADAELKRLWEGNRSAGHLHPTVRAELCEEEARLALVRGRYGQAVAAYRRASGEYQTARLHVQRRDSLLNEAEVLVLLNQVGAAAERLAEVRALNPDADALARIAWVEQAAGERTGDWQADAAPPVARLQGVTLPPREAESPPRAVRSFALAGFLARFDLRAAALRRLLPHAPSDDSARALREIQADFAGTDSRLILARLKLLTAEVAWHTGRPADAWQELDGLVAELDALELAPEAWQAARYRAQCAIDLRRPPVEIADLVADADGRLAALSGSLDPDAARVYLLNKWTPQERQVAAEVGRVLDAHAAAQQAPWYARWWRRARFWQQLDDLLARLDDFKRDRPGGGELAACRRGGLLGTVWRRFTRPRDRVTVSTLVLPDRVFTAGSGWGWMTCATRLIRRVGVRQLVGRWHAAAAEWAGLRSGDNSQHAQAECERQAADAARQVAEASGLADLLARLPARVRRLAVVPDDVFHGMPFAVLPVGGQLVLDRFASRVAYRHADTPARRPPLARTRPLVVGVSSAIAVPVGKVRLAFRRLDGVVPEADGVADWLKGVGADGVVKLLDGEATKAAVTAALGEAGLVHAACHGVFFPDDPARSGLILLSPAPSGAPPDGDILSIAELGGRRFDRLQHVTLASCWGADSFVTPGRWVISLPETLCRCGAGSVLANLWEVDDALARRFAERFYHHARTLPRDEAVRLAQQDVRDTADGRSPFLWAGFQLYGEPGRFRL
jgi:CHAT domain-containing protein/tetratricopeptide (TPR) repeat protein